MIKMRWVLPGCLAAFIVCAVSAEAFQSQDKTDTRMPLNDKSYSASISGRIMLPSGLTSVGNLKIILTTIETPLMTIYTDKHGEFVFRNLKAGTYYVQVFADEKLYEPVNEQIWLNPGAPAYVTIHLKAKVGPRARESRGNTVTAGEVDQQIPVTARKEFEQAQKLITKGAIDSAISHLNQAIEIYPNYLTARNDLGVQYLKQKRLTEAEEQFRFILETSPKYFNARLNLGVVLVEQKRFPESIEELIKAAALDGSHPAVHLFWGIASLEMNDLPVAERELVKSLVLGGRRFSSAHYYFAHVYLKTGRREQAANELRLFLETKPSGEMATQANALLKELSGK